MVSFFATKNCKPKHIIIAPPYVTSSVVTPKVLRGNQRLHAGNALLAARRNELKTVSAQPQTGHFSALKSTLNGETSTEQPQDFQQTSTSKIEHYDIPLLGGIAAAALKNGQVAAARYWVLAHDYVNRRGGFKTIHHADLLDYLTETFGHNRRYAREQLQQYDGIFWERVKGKKWLIFGQPVVSVNLGVDRHQAGSRVWVNSADLVGSYHDARRAFYTAALQGMNRDGLPTSRAAIEDAMSIPPRTQSSLTKKAPQITTKKHFEVLGSLKHRDDFDGLHDYAAEYGSSVFQLCDIRGKRGEAYRWYAARVMPNSYSTTYQTVTTGKSTRKAINSKIRSIIGERETFGNESKPKRIYYRQQVRGRVIKREERGD